MTQVLFTCRDNIGSSIIKAVSWSSWSHVQILNGDRLIGASYPAGVVEETLKHRIDISSKAAIVNIPTLDDEVVFDYMLSQLGKPYDLIGALGLAVHRDWQEDDCWWCSELVAAAIHKGGIKLFRENTLNRITPQHIFMLPYEIQYLK